MSAAGLPPDPELSILGRAARQVLEAAADQQVRREQDLAATSLGHIADRPVVKPAPGAIDAVTDEDRRAAASVKSRALADVLKDRRSQTADLHPPTRLDLVTLLFLAARIQSAGRDEDTGALWSLRPSPSAGAIHPFDLLLGVDTVQGLAPGYYVFGPNAISLRPMSQTHDEYAATLSQSVRRASRRAQPAPATLYLIASPARTANRYSAPLTLILRDAGALLATMHLVATDLGLRSSIVGTAGHFFSTGPGDGPDLEGFDCGALVLGRP